MERTSKMPLYRQIVDYFKTKIDSGELLPEEKLPTEVELASRFHVSRITSKKALEELEKMSLIYRIQGSGSYVSSVGTDGTETDTRTDKNAYISGAKVVAIVLPFDITNGRLTDCIKGASEILYERGYFLTIHCADRSGEKEKVILHHLYQNGIDGIIFYPLSDYRNLDIIHMLNVHDYPMVTIDKYFESLPVSYVISDNYRGSYDAVDYLAKCGHRKIAYISDVPIESASSVRNRYFGYIDALRSNELELNYELIRFNINELGARMVDSNNALEDQEYVEVLRETLLELLQKGVTAVITVNDYVAINIIDVCRMSGIKVPQKLSVIGFDNLELTQFISVPLTSVEQDFYEIGKAAASILIDQVEGIHKECVKCVIPTRFIERKSCRTID